MSKPTKAMTVKMTQKNETQEEVIALLAQVLEGLQVPLSLPGGLLGTAREPLVQLRHKLGLFGYPDAEEIVKRLHEALES